MTAKRLARASTVLCMTFLFALPCFADEIEFQNPKGPQTGIVVKEDAGSVTIKFQRQAIKSITKRESESSNDPGNPVIWQQSNDYLILKIPRDSIQVVPQPAETTATAKEQASSSPPGFGDDKGGGHIQLPEPVRTTEAAQSPPAEKNMRTQQALLLEEMGRAQGTIRWQKKPLPNARVKIVLQSYTGFSLAALKRWYGPEGGSQQEGPIALETRTDAEGRYFFPKAPPGYYRLYWMPDAGTGWVHRVREKPDLEVISGNLTIENVPEKTQ